MFMKAILYLIQCTALLNAAPLFIHFDELINRMSRLSSVILHNEDTIRAFKELLVEKYAKLKRYDDELFTTEFTLAALLRLCDQWKSKIERYQDTDAIVLRGNLNQFREDATKLKRYMEQFRRLNVG
ncbi:hypothetical protein D915_008206 [Fasciola hepatica]|uniref:Uncharacterized protein n=1 Tax=Fasciola hepatica TaxID=6192 RepID=A0A4E0R1G4_FASHE|nr:hypothetical protein D915_008206 [Fasciola hepatica]